MNTLYHMKTVYHWKNIVKTFLFSILAALPVGVLPIPYYPHVLVGILVEVVVMLLCMRKWDMWHFVYEWDWEEMNDDES